MMERMFDSAPSSATSQGVTLTTPYTRRVRSPQQLALVERPESVLSNHALHADLLGNHGEVFTRRWVVDLILDLAGYDSALDLSRMVAIEPACGHGAFLIPMVERLIASCKSHEKPVTTAVDAIHAYDLLPANVRAARAAVSALLVNHGVDPEAAQSLAKGWIVCDDFLLSERDAETADFVVGNPPYIRLEDIPEARSNAYRSACPTMAGRADIFVGFYEHGLRSLKQEGRLAYICADRWMRNAYGKGLRALVAADYSVDVTISMHDVDAFEEQVSAYPAITVIRAGDQGPAVIADATAAFDEREAAAFTVWFRQGQGEPLRREGLRAAWLGHWFTTQAGWPTGSPDRLALVADLEERFPLLEETGAKVGIGLASGADEIYVTKKEYVAEPNRMLPMVMRSDIGSGKVDWSGHYLVNPWEPTGLVDLSGLAATALLFPGPLGQVGQSQRRETESWPRASDHRPGDQRASAAEEVTARRHEQPNLAGVGGG